MTDPYPPGDRREEAALGPDQAGPNAVPELLQTAGLASDATSGQASRRSSVSPDLGCYEIRFRLTGLAAYGLCFGLLLIAIGIFRHQSSLYERVIIAALGGLTTLQYVIPLVSRKSLFRAGPTGVTLGTLGLFGFSSSAVFIPWTAIKKIALYKITRTTRRFRTGSYMVIVPRAEVSGRALRIDAWRLDPERLAAVAATAAPDVPVVDAGDIDPWADADIKRVLQMLSK